MDDSDFKQKIISNVSIETIARSIFKEADELGFKRENYVALANLILDKAIHNELHYITTDAGFPKYPDDSLPVDFPLKSDKIIIRKFENQSDREFFESWLDDEIGRYFLKTRVSPREYSTDDLMDKDADLLGMITLPDGKPIGVMAFLDFDAPQKKAELRKLIGDAEYRGRGLGKEATKLWLNFGTATLGLTKIYLNTLETNVRNIKLNQELGFQIEGILRDELIVDGNSMDILRMALVVD